MSDDGVVHRLLDIVVEEVSLVDRAANKRRFLIVKRDDDMAQARGKAKPPKADENEGTDEGDAEASNKQPKRPFPKKKAAPKKPADSEEVDTEEEEETPEEDAPPAKRRGSKKEATNPESPFGIALAMLDKLASAVEELEADPDDNSAFAPLADELREAGDEIAKAAGVEEDPAEEAAEESDVASLVEAVREMLARLDELLGAIVSGAASETKAAEGAGPAAAEAPPDIAKKLSEIASSMKAIDISVRAQGARLAGLEKRTGLPNSRAPEESSRARDREKVSWPMDINKPLDRESVDKSTSFHD